MDSKHRWFRWLPTGMVIAVFGLGFLGQPEDIPWLNATPLWASGDPFFRSGDLLIASPVTIWRGTPGAHAESPYAGAGIVNRWRHNALGLRDDELVAKPAGVVRILNLGDSATWGLNLERREDSYSDQLEALLADAVTRGSVSGAVSGFDVINGGTIGFSSFQGARFLEQHLDQIDPDVVTIYLGNNDPGRSRIPDSARGAASLGAVSRVLSGNLFYLLLRKAYYSIRQGRAQAERNDLESLFSDENQPSLQTKDDYYRTLARVPPADYARNLREMAGLVRRANRRLLLLEVPMNLVWPPPVARPTPVVGMQPWQHWNPVQIEPGYLAAARAGRAPGARPLAGHPYLSLVTPEQANAFFGDRAPALLDRFREQSRSTRVTSERIRALHNLAVWSLIQGDVDDARRKLEQAVADLGRCRPCPDAIPTAMTHYLRGVVALVEGQTDTAFDHLLAAREAWPFAMSPDYARAFDEVVADLDIEFIDLPQRFALRDPQFRGSRLMHDWVHPNRAGNRLIAEAISERLLTGPP